MSGAVRRRRTALKGELGGELAALLDAGRKLRGELEAPPLRPGELPRLPEPRVPSYHLTGERARLAREAGSYEHHAHAPRVTDRELAREAERYHMERELELAERAGELGQAFDDLDDEQAAELLAELDDNDPPF